jgi:SAM-dependent methyltransferase
VLFPESLLAHRLLDPLRGLEIGASAHNPFGLRTRNVDFTSENTSATAHQLQLSGRIAHVDVVAPDIGHTLPFPSNSEGFVVASHVIEHMPSAIGAVEEWLRVVRRNGYVFLIVPDMRRNQVDMGKNATLLEEHLRRTKFANSEVTAGGAELGHSSFWTARHFIAMCLMRKWVVVAVQDIDDKVGNGFTVVIRKPWQ